MSKTDSELGQWGDPIGGRPNATELPSWLVPVGLICGVLWLCGLGSLLAVIVGGYAIHLASTKGEGPGFLPVATTLIGALGVAVTVLLSAALVLLAGGDAVMVDSDVSPGQSPVPASVVGD